MHKHIADKWTAALRSGDYAQGRDALHVNGTFCCLGVLCDLHRQEVGGEWGHHQSPELTISQGTLTYMAPGGDWDYCLLPKEVAVWAGMRSPNPCVNDEPLSHLNDSGWGFDRIAELIETGREDL